jgi:hypothetical protein
MALLTLSVVLLVCTARATLGQDCSTPEEQEAFLTRGAADNPNCYKPIIALFTQQTADIEAICKESSCIGDVVDFLKGCTDDEDIQEVVNSLKLCTFSDAEDSKGTRCVELIPAEENLLTAQISMTILACLSWWTGGGMTCPSGCAEQLKTSVEQTYGCCYQSIFGTEQAINETTQGVAARLPNVPEDFEVDPTDPKLFEACDVSLPAVCPSVFDSAPTATPTATPTAVVNSAPTAVVTPVVILLFALLAKSVA